MAGLPPQGYANALAAAGGPKPAMPPAAGGAPPPPPLPALGSAMGAPPPAMTGKVPTGAGAVPSKVALGTAIQNLREVKTQYPDSAGDIDKWITMLQSMANPAKPVPASGGDAGAAAPDDSAGG